MTTLKDNIDSDLAYYQRQYEHRREYYVTHRDHIEMLLADFPHAENTTPTVDTTSLDIAVHGDKEVLRDVMAYLFKHGLHPNEKPEENETNYATYWYPQYPEITFKVWLNFTSTVCKRVQVGTETVERPIYEVQCD